MRISDWSSDVCSSDLAAGWHRRAHSWPPEARASRPAPSFAEIRFPACRSVHPGVNRILAAGASGEIGRAACRESEGPYVVISVGAVTIKKKQDKYHSRYAHQD